MAAGICSLAMVVACGSSKPSYEAVTGEQILPDAPCSDCYDTRDIIRARGERKSTDKQMAQQMARSNAIEQLGAKMKTALEAVTSDYFKNYQVRDEGDASRRTEGKIDQIVKLSIQGYRTVCEKYTFENKPNGSRVYTCHLCIEIDKADVERSLYKGITSDDKLRLDYDYEKFKDEFEKKLSSVK